MTSIHCFNSKTDSEYANQYQWLSVHKSLLSCLIIFVAIN